jgi:hypothetical protein
MMDLFFCDRDFLFTQEGERKEEEVCPIQKARSQNFLRFVLCAGDGLKIKKFFLLQDRPLNV